MSVRCFLDFDSLHILGICCIHLSRAYQIGGLTFSASIVGDQYVIEKTVVTAIRWTRDQTHIRYERGKNAGQTDRNTYLIDRMCKQHTTQQSYRNSQAERLLLTASLRSRTV
ncbi:conserved hypothetical protein [Trichinella spiralis]|uniref:hypothetical protein n=1 Tax=Trichinella spiralis TaxID=6334 RepID=UPI0001EFE411|nr:conserved hypothetical protein [Trichinella spiralis]XP_003366511.1 conserved hypothetical protein [Trichinella spiralis]XP_003367997.1 conserved hypothetical protein [Trichinella spiralis]